MIHVNRSRVLSLALALLLILTSLSSSVFAATELTSKEILDLKAFGILEGDENGELNLDKTITRAEFSKLVVVMMQYEDAADAVSTTAYFYDMTQDHWAYGYVMTLASLGLINGMPDGNFYPEQEITYYEAVKILVNALGYYTTAEGNGGYPLGYAITGGQIGITNGVIADGDTALLRADAMRLVYNCLDATRLEWVSTDANGNETYRQASQTLRDLLMGNVRTGLAEIRAVITANYDSYLYDEIPGMEEWQVQANQTLFNKGETDAEKYLGQEVDMYVRADGSLNGQYTIEQIMPTNNNTILTVDKADIHTLEATRIEYINENEKTQTGSIADDAVYLYNGRPIAFDDLEFEEIGNGSVELISNDGNSVYDVVMIQAYESFEVESVDLESNQFILTAEKKFNGQRRVSLDDDANQTNTKLLDKDGAAMELENLMQGDIVSIFASADNTLLRIMASDQTAEGVVREVWADEDSPRIVIEEESYLVESGVDVSGLVGREVTAKLNFEGKVVSVKSGVSNKQYAAVIGVAADSVFGDQVSVRLVLSGALSEEVEEQEDTGESGQEDSIPALSAKNSQLQVYELASKVRYSEPVADDSTTGETTSQVLSSAEMKEQLEREIAGRGFFVVSYKLDSSGKISRMEVPEAVGTFTSKTYNAYEKTFGKALTGGAFGVTDDTLSICIPSEGVSSDYDYLAKVKMTNNQSYDVIGYDYNDQTFCPDLIVIYAPMSYTSSGNIIATSKVGVVTAKETFIDDNGDTGERATLMTPEGEKTYIISDHSNSDQDLSLIQPGNVMFYSLDPMDYLDGYQLLSSCKPLPESRIDTVGTNMVFVGSVLDVNYNVVSNTANRWVDELICTTDGGSQTTFEIRHESTPPIYIYNSMNDTVELGDSLDFLSAHQRVIVCATSATRQVKAVVMIV